MDYSSDADNFVPQSVQNKQRSQSKQVRTRRVINNSISLQNLRKDAAPQVEMDMSIPEISQSVANSSVAMSNEEERKLVMAANKATPVASSIHQSSPLLKMKRKDR